MVDVDLEEFLSRKHYAFDFQALIGDVADFLELSELNIEDQFQRESEMLSKRGDFEGYPVGYREHLLENAEHRFSVSLPMRIRYAALVALVTTVEWETKILRECASIQMRKASAHVNATVHSLRCLDEATAVGSTSVIADYERLVVVRNAVVHSAGIERDYRYRDALRESVRHLHGFSIANWHFVGECVRIEKGALMPYINAMAELLPTLWRHADERGLLRRTNTTS